MINEKGIRTVYNFNREGLATGVLGQVNKIDKIYRYIVVGEGKIFFDDIYEIKIS